MSVSVAQPAPAIGTAELLPEQVAAKQAASAEKQRRLVKTVAIKAVSLAVVLVAWQVIGSGINEVLFTVPSKIVLAGVQMIGSGELWFYLAPSLLVLIVGLAIACVLGIGTGLLLARYWALDTALDMYVTFLYSIPSVALLPVIVLWAGFDFQAKVIVLVLFAYFPLAINTYQGVKNVDPKLLEVGRAFRCSEGQLWRNVVLPGSLPFIVTGLRLAVGRGLIGMVLADLYTAISGIGYLIVRSASTYRVDKMFVPIVLLGVLGIAFTALLRVVERKVAPWTLASTRE
ncbi:MAG TPA: ABC transporter permease [Chloroflexota bacterium]